MTFAKINLIILINLISKKIPFTQCPIKKEIILKFGFWYLFRSISAIRIIRVIKIDCNK